MSTALSQGRHTSGSKPPELSEGLQYSQETSFPSETMFSRRSKLHKYLDLQTVVHSEELVEKILVHQ